MVATTVDQLRVPGRGGFRSDWRAQRALHAPVKPGLRMDLLAMSEAQIEALERSGQLDSSVYQAITYDWREWARPQQLEPINAAWRTWLILAGRGWGKTRTGAEWIKHKVATGSKRIALVARTAADARDVMLEGESGLLNLYPDHERPIYQPSKRRVTWANGATATLFSAKEPDLLRGPQFDAAWADELASWRDPDAWSNLMFALRLPPDPQVVVTTTPRPTPLIRGLLNLTSTVVDTGNSYDNRANMAPAFFEEILGRYEGTRLGLQEIYAELLDDAPGALWKREAMIDAYRVVRAEMPELYRVVVAIDPAVSANAASNSTGIIVAGIAANGHVYVLDDATRMAATPTEWATAAIRAFDLRQADAIVAEVNNGGDLVEHTIRTVRPDAPYKAVRASRGKYIRAEPVSALYEQGKVHHVGMFGELEDELTGWEPGDPSPDRLDALVWAVTELALDGNGPPPEELPMDTGLLNFNKTNEWARL